MRRKCEAWSFIVSFPCHWLSDLSILNIYLERTVIYIFNMRREIGFFIWKFIIGVIIFQIYFQGLYLLVLCWQQSLLKHLCIIKLKRHWRVEEPFGITSTQRRSNDLAYALHILTCVIEEALLCHSALSLSIILLPTTIVVLRLWSKFKFFSTLETFKWLINLVYIISIFFFFK